MKDKAGLFAYGEMGGSVFKSLYENFDLLWVVLPQKSKQTKAEQKIEEFARINKIPICYKYLDKDLYAFIKKNTPDIIVTASFNRLISKKIIKLTKFVNIHLGDLPRYRGRANVNWAIINNRSSIGIVVHELVPDMDAGNIYKLKMIPILTTDDVSDVYIKINLFLQENISNILKKVLNGFKGLAQTGNATYCCTRLPEDGLINWNKTTLEIYNLIRGITKPYPGAFTYFNGKKMIIWDSEILKKPQRYEGRIPGRVVRIIPNQGIEVLTGDSVILVKNINFLDKDRIASDVIKSVKSTLGINLVSLYEKIYEN